MKQNNDLGFKSQAMKLINDEVIPNSYKVAVKGMGFPVDDSMESVEVCFISEQRDDQTKMLVEGTWQFDIGYRQSTIVTLTNPTVGLVADLALGQKMVELRRMSNEQAERQLEDIACFFEALSWDDIRNCFMVETGS